MKGKLLVIGFGPGSFEHITKRAREALQESDVIIGYSTYVELIQGLLTDQEVVSTGMTEEVSRAREAVRQAETGKKVAVISSGDAGVYGMAGLIYEVLVEQGWKKESGVEVEIVPGISAINSCAALLGAPIMHDACTISLSDHLTPWDLIARRIEAAGQADFVIALYNPRSGRRTRQIVEAQKILLKYRSPDTPVGLVKSAYRDRQHVIVTTLERMLDHDIGMLTTVVIGNTSTFLYDGLMITPRGYQRKYTLTADEQPLKPHQRLKAENEPWALEQETFETPKTPLEWATEALSLINPPTGQANHQAEPILQQESIFEFAVSPGVANKKFTPRQMIALAEVAGEKGSIEYTPHHQIILRIPAAQPEEVTERLRTEGFILAPIGDVIQVKACDFCDGEKNEPIPYAEQLQQSLGGMEVPKELKIGFNGCGMACYGAVQEDIGIVFRKGKFDLFLGAKTVGRNAHSGIPVAEGIEPAEIVPLVEEIVAQFKQNGYPNERFHKFFKRVGEVKGFRYQEMPAVSIEPAACGD
ncbi:precorrin-3B C(17)-methyltransferase [Ammoniphilus sp. 3BR4]|uniref:precorrin-3B C(17)-methyltransferase n=1 Tax=Ammoniphilus sp. 3BR4 TaxID=3158265 RepID=UPI00346690C2